jgi:hypothetical protein
MSGYQRFLPRDGMRTASHAIAEIAEGAEVETVQGLRAAEAVLKPAELRPRAHQPQQTSAEVQRQQSHRIPQLQQLQQLQQATGPKVAKDGAQSSHTPPSPPKTDGRARLGVPADWGKGVLRLSIMPSPPRYPELTWQQLILDAQRFLDEWAVQAAALGWPGWELFGCHRRAPFGRIEGMGLVLLLRGKELVALTDAEAVIRSRTGARQAYQRKSTDPLHPAERCLVWELAGEC